MVQMMIDEDCFVASRLAMTGIINKDPLPGGIGGEFKI
jgi:hypothetical protein